ncbi:MAG: hypothetical protein IJ060_05430 [Oscillospiraceae bacterium]|nr:hypothetical protein [Oscillospiraceae bacterium]
MAEQKHRSRKRIVIAAALLAVIGGAAAVIGFSLKSKQDAQNAPESKLGLHLTEQQDIPSRAEFAKSEKGFYFIKSERDYMMGTSTVQQETQDILPVFCDPETGEWAVLCARPNCMHDGSTFCTATTKVYGEIFPPFRLTYADGYLYAVRTKRSKWIPNGYGGEMPDEKENHVVLLRYEPDGSGITELHDFGTGTGEFKPVLHRGYLWFVVPKYSYGEPVKNPITGEEMQFTNGGYEIWGYELKTGDLVRIYDSEPKPDQNHVDTPPKQLCGIGDYICFNTEEGDWSAPFGTNRINLLTGEMTQAPKCSFEYGFSEGYALYFETKHQDHGIVNTWQLVNLETGESKNIPETAKPTQYLGTPFLSGDYIYWCQVDENGKYSVRIYNMNAEIVTELDMKDCGLPEYPPEWDGILIIDGGITEISGGMAYLKLDAMFNDTENGITWELHHAVYSCPVNDLLDGKPVWQKVYEEMDGAEAEKQYRALLADKQSTGGNRNDAE